MKKINEDVPNVPPITESQKAMMRASLAAYDGKKKIIKWTCSFGHKHQKLLRGRQIHAMDHGIEIYNRNTCGDPLIAYFDPKDFPNDHVNVYYRTVGTIEKEEQEADEKLLLALRPEDFEKERERRRNNFLERVINRMHL